jgi:hypothetical protein
MAGVFRRNGIYLPRLWWWYPWGITRWRHPEVWRGSTEWCDTPLCLNDRACARKDSGQEACCGVGWGFPRAGSIGVPC